MKERTKSKRRHRKASASGVPWPLCNVVVGVSVANSENLLEHGMGEEHLREALRTLCRPLLRYGADLAYGGYFRADADLHEINYTREMIDLIGAEQDEGEGGSWSSVLYNFSPWPFCEKITTEDRARWIDTCTFLPISEEDAELLEHERVGEACEGVSSLRIAFNKAVVLSAMRRKMVEGMALPRSKWPKRGQADQVRAHARILVGGKVLGTSGIMPGVFEEALTTIEAEKPTPLFILGGFGGAASALAEALGGEPGTSLPPQFERAFYAESVNGRESQFVLLEQAFEKFDPERRFRHPHERLADLSKRIKEGRGNLKSLLRNGLDDSENRRLFKTTDAAEAAHYIQHALGKFARKHKLYPPQAP